MRTGSKARARLRVAYAAVLVIGALALGGSALAEARERAVSAWVRGVETSLHVVRIAIPPPGASTATLARAPEPSASPVLRPRRVHRAPAQPLTADERLDDVRARFCPEAARRLCRARGRCGCVIAEPDCQARVEARCTDLLFSNFENVAESAELDPVALDRCLDGFAAVPTHCQLWPAVVHGCMWPVRDVAERNEDCGNVGGRCRGGICEADSICRAAAGLGAVPGSATCARELVSLDGMCVLASELGGACADYRQCGDSLYDCTDGRCVPRPRAGASCESSAGCDAGLVCSVGVCTRAPTWCDAETDCGSEQECERGGETGRCGPTLCRVGELEALFDRLN